MDTKSLAKSKRAHSQHHKKHHPSQKAKVTTSSVGPSGADKAPGKVVKEKPRNSQGPAALPSNWDRYEDEYNSSTENQKGGPSSQLSDIIVPKSKGADYAYLISEAKSQNSTRTSSEIFPSLDDLVSDFGQGKDSFFAVRGESLLSSIQNDSFFVEDKKSASYEASFLTLNLQALSEQLAKIDLPKRLFMEDDLFPPQLYFEREEERRQDNDNTIRNELQVSNDHEGTSYDTTKSPYHQEDTGSNTLTLNSIPKLKTETAEDGFFPPQLYSERGKESRQDHDNASRNELQASNHHEGTLYGATESNHPEGTSSITVTPKSNLKFKAETAEAELDMLLDSFSDANLKEVSISKKKTVAIDIDDTLDDLLKETSMVDQSEPRGFVSQPVLVSKSELNDDFDSWLDTI